jgi:hypothetical protein
MKVSAKNLYNCLVNSCENLVLRCEYFTNNREYATRFYFLQYEGLVSTWARRNLWIQIFHNRSDPFILQ